MTRNDENFKISPPGEMTFKLGAKELSELDGVQEWKFDVSKISGVKRIHEKFKSFFRFFREKWELGTKF